MTTIDESTAATRQQDWIQRLVGEPGAAWLIGAKLREWVALVGMVIVADLLLFRGQGFLGVAVFFIVAPALLVLGAHQRSFRWSLVIQGGLLALLCSRLAWQGSALQMICGFALIAGFAASLSGLTPHLVTVLATAGQCAIAGAQFISGYLMGIRGTRRPVDGIAVAKGLLPVVVVIVFGTIFVLANPDAVKVVYDKFVKFFDSLSRFMVDLDLSAPEVIFWAFTIWITVGLFRPLHLLKQLRLELPDNGAAKPAMSNYYSAYRNTLVAVIVLFAGYLVVEFSTLWFREFPKNFYYAGYAHQGAAWLTVALALATAVLSVVFSRATQLDPRAATLRKLAYIWSFENLLLSIAVYNRLFIYVGYNGMTYWRIVGIFGISVVVAGFALVVWKIIREKSFLWLVHRQLWAVSLAVYLFAITPVDAIAVRYNVNRILSGDVAACMQIGVQKLDAEGKMLLFPLLNVEDAEIRTGVHALLVEEYRDATRRKFDSGYLGWTAIQFANRAALHSLDEHFAELSPLVQDDAALESALKRFHDYAYQWY